MDTQATLTLKHGRDKSLLRRHPWIFSGAVASVQGEPGVGQTVDVVGADGTRYGRAAYSPNSKIVARMWSFDPSEEVGPGFLHARLEQAILRRRALTDVPGPQACRLVYGESDGLPGLIVDRYADFLVCQFAAAGVDARQEELVNQLEALVPCTGIYERSDLSVRKKEGLPQRTGVLRGATPPELLEIQEGAHRFLVDIVQGHKTGFYLDQRESRARLGAHAEGRDVLNCFSYTGSFAVSALGAGAASVTNVESSPGLLDLTRKQLELNGLDLERCDNVQGSVGTVLRQFRDSRRTFDLIILDPPRFAESRTQLESASRAYKDVNLLAFKLLKPGGLLFTFSCSGHMTPDLFQKIVADAALDARREAHIVERLAQPPDHPVSLNFPEAGYLKGLVCRAL